MTSRTEIEFYYKDFDREHFLEEIERLLEEREDLRNQILLSAGTESDYSNGFDDGWTDAQENSCGCI